MVSQSRCPTKDLRSSDGTWLELHWSYIPISSHLLGLDHDNNINYSIPVIPNYQDTPPSPSGHQFHEFPIDVRSLYFNQTFDSRRVTMGKHYSNAR